MSGEEKKLEEKVPPDTNRETLDMSYMEKEENQHKMAPEPDYSNPNQEHYYGVKDPERTLIPITSTTQEKVLIDKAKLKKSDFPVTK